MIKNILLISFVFLTALSAHSYPSNNCLVVGISDGDTITCLMIGNKPIKIRLEEIDAPERNQPFGKKSKQQLSKLIYKRRVSLKISGQDRYKRTLATVYYNGKNINLEMVKSGMAWAYNQYLHHPIYLYAQEKAQAQRLGLWADRFPISPHEWRKQEKKYGF
ncbi:thermonuclease family protein [Rodentibacter pneumotropicus]|nr:thermonuclease family protein [Rodentibacter pneumotropicus]MDC2824743.1 thermonuclease family protein [Rodentibacter pneumotropicus]NBH74761.1 thermonuclease family protein [Rodentibacter pneumotropicus]OOF62828.1 nuclease [Rodentibacter pneumotropicus]OOF65378.1 nuclease [Rodentibacter pneumotropicus]THA02639.1 thermonuclease family protein [Rodentibacter pneumotropicus]